MASLACYGRWLVFYIQTGNDMFRFLIVEQMIFFSSFPYHHLLWLIFALLYILLTFLTRRDRSSSSSFSSSSEMVGVDLKAIVFFFCGAISSLAFLSISWVLRLSIRPMSSISSLSLNSFNIVALTSHDGGSARMTFWTF